jgi:hypothetical protein
MIKIYTIFIDISISYNYLDITLKVRLTIFSNISSLTHAALRV